MRCRTRFASRWKGGGGAGLPRVWGTLRGNPHGIGPRRRDRRLRLQQLLTERGEPIFGRHSKENAGGGMRGPVLGGYVELAVHPGEQSVHPAFGLQAHLGMDLGGAAIKFREVDGRRALERDRYDIAVVDFR